MDFSRLGFQGSVNGTYTNANPTTVTVGGIPAGTTFNQVSMPDMWSMLLYAYLPPAFTSFFISALQNPLEVGANISGGFVFNWGTSNSGNIQANSLALYDITGVETLYTGLANTGSMTHAFIIPVQLIAPGSYTWRIEGTNTHADLFNHNFSINWYWRRYWGVSDNASLTGADILAFPSSDLSTVGTATITFQAANYKYFCIPTSFVQPTQFKDQSTGITMDMAETVIVSVTNVHGISTNYSVYRTMYKLGAPMTIIFS